MTLENQDVTGYYAGDTLRLDVSVTDDADQVVNLTGATIEWKLIDYKTVLLSKSTSAGISITDPLNGEFRVNINGSETQDLQGTYRHEARVTDSTGNVSTVFVGSFSVI